MIGRDELIDLFERMERENWAYAWGAAEAGCVDCSGAFVYAYGALGGPSIAHGSNSILRQSMGALLPMREAQPGYAAVKIRSWTDGEKGNQWYGQEPGDCYHIGLVGRDGKILNAQGTATGFVQSDPGTWAGCAPLLAVDYGDEEDLQQEATLYSAVVSTREDPLTLRDSPYGAKIGKLPKGSTVNVLAERDGWMRVRYGNMLGWASGQYLSRIYEEGGNMTIRLVIRDEAGNEFRPVGTFTVGVETTGGVD